MKKKYKIPLTIFLAVSGLLMLTIKVDRIDANLRADEGQTNGIVLTANTQVEQQFHTSRSSISNIGFYLRPTAKQIPAGDITLSLFQNNQSLNSITVSTAFVDIEGLTQFELNPPISINSRLPIIAALSVDPSLDGAIRLQLRELSAEQDASTVSLQIDDQPSFRPAGFKTFSPIHPPLAIQLGSLLILTAILIFIPRLSIYTIGAALIFIIPAPISTDLKVLIFLTSATAMLTMFTLLRFAKLTRLPSLFGAHIFAFNTWFLLQLGDGRQLYSLVSILPLLVILLFFRQSISARSQRRFFITVIILIAALTYLSAPTSLLIPLNDHAHPRDIFLDPVQSLPAAKIVGAPWSNFGAYIGLINLSLAILGLTHQVKKYWPIALTGLLAYLLVQLAPTTFFTPQHLIIITVFSLAWFAALGLQGLRLFFSLATPSSQHKYFTIIILLITIIALLDLWQVSATVWN